MHPMASILTATLTKEIFGNAEIFDSEESADDEEGHPQDSTENYDQLVDVAADEDDGNNIQVIQNKDGSY